jgi:hypothetical protein
MNEITGRRYTLWAAQPSMTAQNRQGLADGDDASRNERRRCVSERRACSWKAIHVILGTGLGSEEEAYLA